MASAPRPATFGGIPQILDVLKEQGYIADRALATSVHLSIVLNKALYEWNYQRQMLRIKLEEASLRPVEDKEHVIFSEPFLLKRPLLQAITAERAPVLLIDEVDRADEEFEAFLLEVLSDFQVSIPEIGTITA